MFQFAVVFSHGACTVLKLLRNMYWAWPATLLNAFGHFYDMLRCILVWLIWTKTCLDVLEDALLDALFSLLCFLKGQEVANVR